MSLNAYINDFKDGRTLKEKCSVCNKTIKGEFYSLGTHDRGTRAQVKENRLCSKRCMNSITLQMNAVHRREYGKNINQHSDSDL